MFGGVALLTFLAFNSLAHRRAILPAIPLLPS
jgi:hypothetical protein